MIVNAWGVVLARRDHGEADRLCTLYTETLGKLLVRFVGVNKPGRKLKALSEPLCWGEYRLYVTAKSEVAKCVGGQLIGCFPTIRADLARTVEALGCLELVNMMTAAGAPNPAEYELLTGALQALETEGSPWLPPAFGIRLLDLAGYGMPDRAFGPEAALAQVLREQALDTLSEIPFDAHAAARLREAVHSHAEAQAGRPLKSRAVAAGLGFSSEALRA